MELQIDILNEQCLCRWRTIAGETVNGKWQRTDAENERTGALGSLHLSESIFFGSRTLCGKTIPPYAVSGLPTEDAAFCKTCLAKGVQARRVSRVVVRANYGKQPASNSRDRQDIRLQWWERSNIPS